MSDTTIITIAGGTFTLLGTIFAGVINYKLTQLKSKADNVGVVAAATHKLINSEALAHLRLHMVVTRRLAEISKANNTPGWEMDAEAAITAEKSYNEHAATQVKIDKTSEVTQSIDKLTTK